VKTIEELEAELETVTRERDMSLAAWESAGMQGRTAQSAMLELARQLEEARQEVAEVNAVLEDINWLEDERDKARAWAHQSERERDEARDTIVALTTAKAEADLEIATLTAALDERDVEAERSLEQYDSLVRDRDRLHEQVRTLNGNIETFQREAWRYKHERDEARAALADATTEWKSRRCECAADDFCKIAQERNEARAEVERWRTSYDAASGHAVDVRAMLDQVRKELYEARSEVDRLTDERDELLVRVANQDAELRATREAYNGAHAEVERLMHQLADATNETTRARLEAKRAKDEEEFLTRELSRCRLGVGHFSTHEVRSAAYRRGAEAMREACARVADAHCVPGTRDGIRALPIPEEP
jgi:chromosome segregation ATPase